MLEENKQNLCGDCESMQYEQCINKESLRFAGRVLATMAGCELHSMKESEEEEQEEQEDQEEQNEDIE